MVLMLIVTSFSAAFLGVLLVVLTILTIIARQRFQVILADDGKRALLKIIRAHANLIEYAPIFLILLGLVELNHLLSGFWLFLTAGLFIAGRFLHAISMLFIEPKTLKFRILGMLLTLIPMFKLALILFFKLLVNIFS